MSWSFSFLISFKLIFDFFSCYSLFSWFFWIWTKNVSKLFFIDAVIYIIILWSWLTKSSQLHVVVYTIITTTSTWISVWFKKMMLVISYMIIKLCVSYIIIIWFESKTWNIWNNINVINSGIIMLNSIWCWWYWFES